MLSWRLRSAAAAVLAMGLGGGPWASRILRLVKHDPNEPWSHFLEFHARARLWPPKRIDLAPSEVCICGTIGVKPSLVVARVCVRTWVIGHAMPFPKHPMSDVSVSAVGGRVAHRPAFLDGSTARRGGPRRLVDHFKDGGGCTSSPSCN